MDNEVYPRPAQSRIWTPAVILKKTNRASARINVNADRFGSPAVEWGPAGRTDLVGPVAFRPALTGSLVLSAVCFCPLLQRSVYYAYDHQPCYVRNKKPPWAAFAQEGFWLRSRVLSKQTSAASFPAVSPEQNEQRLVPERR